jgi:hypothetical protein
VHLQRIHAWWTELLKRKEILAWVEMIGLRLRTLPIVPLPAGQ